jgi:hypothetical protein
VERFSLPLKELATEGVLSIRIVLRGAISQSSTRVVGHAHTFNPQLPKDFSLGQKREGRQFIFF